MASAATPCLSSRFKGLIGLLSRATSAPIPAPLLRSYVNIFRSTINTRGFALLVFLYLLRFRRFFKAVRSFALSTVATVAITANFNLDLDANTRRRTLTPAISRLVLMGVLFGIWRKSSRSNVPLYAGLALRVVPTVMFFFFKGLYMALRWSMRRRLASPLQPTKGDLIDPTAQCCVCLEQACNFRTSCGHFFHANCISDWLEVKSRCPICQGPLRPPTEALRSLGQYFILDHGEWMSAHHVFVGSWISEPILA